MQPERTGPAGTPRRADHVTAVISMYSPPEDLAARVAQLAGQVDEIVAVDDGSPAGVGQVHSDLEDLGVHVIALPDNRGIAAALNAGVAWARRRRPEGWVLTMDQDSTLMPGYVEAALGVFRTAGARGVRPGAVAAGTINGTPVPMERPVGDVSVAYDPIQSGLLVPAATFDRVGVFDEDLFIDLVDTEFTLRLKQAGLTTVASPKSGILHALGSPRPLRLGPLTLRLGGRTVAVPYQPPFRVYYMTRNMLLVTRWYARVFPGWLVRRLVLESLQHGVRLLWGPGRLRTGWAICAGVRDFVRGRRGRIPSRTRAALVTRR